MCRCRCGCVENKVEIGSTGGMLWSSQHELFAASCQDICEFETIGLLVILATWPGLLAGRLWVHCIDNVRRLKRRLSVYDFQETSGDDLVGLAWEAHQRTIPWIDRVDSARNFGRGLPRGTSRRPVAAHPPRYSPSQKLLRRLRRRAFG